MIDDNINFFHIKNYIPHTYHITSNINSNQEVKFAEQTSNQWLTINVGYPKY